MLTMTVLKRRLTEAIMEWKRLKIEFFQNYL